MLQTSLEYENNERSFNSSLNSIPYFMVCIYHDYVLTVSTASQKNVTLQNSVLLFISIFYNYRKLQIQPQFYIQYCVPLVLKNKCYHKLEIITVFNREAILLECFSMLIKLRL